MKKIVMLTVILMLTAVVAVAQAEIKAGSVSVTPFAGGYFFENNQNLKDSVVMVCVSVIILQKILELKDF